MTGLDPSELRLTLSRTACNGRCPIYQLQLRKDGEIRFNGIRHTEKLGKIERKLTSRQLSALATAVARSGFLSYQPEQGCSREVTDRPSVILSVRWGGREKEIDRYLGCTKVRPDPLPDLAYQIEEIVEVTRWIRKR